MSNRNIEDHVEAAKARGESGKLKFASLLFRMSFNLVGNRMLSRDLFDSQSREGPEFFQDMDKFIRWGGKPKYCSFSTILEMVRSSRIEKEHVARYGRTIEIVARFVNERIEEHKLGKEKAMDFLDVLLEFEDDGKEWHGKIPHEKIIIIIMVRDVFGGLETTSTTIEWAMAELLRKAETMKKVKEELNIVIGQNRKVEESDIDNLPYLQAVLKETFRLHPAVPLLLSRNTIQDTNFMGYHIPKILKFL
ncbi:hypothetical protein GH714_029227 [Hevea brasiliensis]|uniref:Cytochrome P450 n=1 Tax=Hevea brasiliensis TaxID=3981 RepID=A0A6A6M2I8_HEVBR|nr:hypothetical protein GH714_029227 [Hevea brasiliensis]